MNKKSIFKDGSNKNLTHPQKKKGISLIVLVITIIVMIIIAGAIILTLNNVGIIVKASEAVEKTNLKQVQQIAQLAWAEAYADGVRNVEDLEDGTKGFQTRVIEALNAQDIDLDLYTITVTISGVDVELRDTAQVQVNKYGFYYDMLYYNEAYDYGFISMEDGTAYYVSSAAWADASAEMGARLCAEVTPFDLPTIESVGSEGQTISLNFGEGLVEFTLVEDVDIHGIYIGDTYKFTDDNGVEQTLVINETNCVLMGTTYSSEVGAPGFVYGFNTSDGFNWLLFSSLDGSVCYIDASNESTQEICKYTAYRQDSNS